MPGTPACSNSLPYGICQYHWIVRIHALCLSLWTIYRLSKQSMNCPRKHGSMLEQRNPWIVHIHSLHITYSLLTSLLLRTDENMISDPPNLFWGGIWSVCLLTLGQGCQPDPTKAAQLLTDLAMQAHPYAQVNVLLWLPWQHVLTYICLVCIGRYVLHRTRCGSELWYSIHSVQGVGLIACVY